MTNPNVLRVAIDYDSTLYNTGAFIIDLTKFISDESGVDLKKVTEDLGHFHVDPLLGGYMFENHITSYGLDSEPMWAKLNELTHSKDYLFADSVPFITELRERRYDPRILTFGEDRYQKVKVIPNLGKLATHGSELGYDVIFRKKTGFIAEYYPGETGTLVDDVKNQNLPEGFTEIHLDRKQSLLVPSEKPGGFTVSNLEQALQVITTL